MIIDIDSKIKTSLEVTSVPKFQLEITSELPLELSALSTLTRTVNLDSNIDLEEI